MIRDMSMLPHPSHLKWQAWSEQSTTPSPHAGSQSKSICRAAMAPRSAAVSNALCTTRQAVASASQLAYSWAGWDATGSVVVSTRMKRCSTNLVGWVGWMEHCMGC